MKNYFDAIADQEKALTQIKKLYTSKRVPHALLFYGEEGTGKFFTALQFLKLLNDSQSNPSIEKKIKSLSEPIFKYIFPMPRGKGEGNDDTATEKLTEKQIQLIHEELAKKRVNPYHKIELENANTIKISSIREIRKFLSLDYSDIKYRMILIEDAHKMNSESQNALLKSLEEPPDGVIIVLTTPYIEKLLPTIQSRCWRINFNNLRAESVKTILKEYFEINDDNAEVASLFSGGSVTKAVKLLESDLKSLMHSAIQILRYSLGNWLNSAILESNKIIEIYDKETYKEMIILVLTWLNDVMKERIDLDNFYFKDFKETLSKFNKNFPDSNIENIYNEVDRLLQSIDNNVLLNVISLNLILQLNSIVYNK